MKRILTDKFAEAREKGYIYFDSKVKKYKLAPNVPEYAKEELRKLKTNLKDDEYKS